MQSARSASFTPGGDDAYAVELKNLYQNKMISKSGYEKSVSQIPDYILTML